MLTDHIQLSILAQSPDATAIYHSAALHISFVNDAMLKIWGKERSITGKTFEEALPEMKGQPFIDLLKSVWESGLDYRATDTPATLKIDGVLKTSYFDFEYSAIKDEHGKVIAILHTSRDVSSRVLALQQLAEKQHREDQLIAELTKTGIDIKAANDHLSNANKTLHQSNEDISRLNFRLQESETDFKRLVEQAPVAILVFRGHDMVIDLVNEAMLEILDKDPGIIGKPLLSGLPELKGEPAVNLLFDVYHSGKSFDGMEAPVKMKREGKFETRYFNFSYRPLLDNGEIIGVMDVAVEVTEQVLARKSLEEIITEKSALEQTLRANEQRLQDILDTMAEGVVIVDTDGKPTYANATAQRIMGLNEEALKSRRYDDTQWKNERVDGSPLPIEDHPMYVAMHTGLPVYDQEIGIAATSKEKLYISINAAPLIDDQQRVTGGIVTFTDVTARRKVLQQKDDFISVASHELKTPVTTLKASLQLLERMQDQLGSALAQKLVQQAVKSLGKLNLLIGSLLNSDRIRRGRFPIHKTTFNIGALINDCCQHIRTASSHEIIFKGDQQQLITADEQLLDQVIINLVNNAVKYAANSKEIIIEVQQTEAHTRISVTDFGPGISPEKAKHIFERYYQGDNFTREFSGLGLGLYISKEIIEKHGGLIGVDSEPGKGSTFWFTIPR